MWCDPTLRKLCAVWLHKSATRAGRRRGARRVAWILLAMVASPRHGTHARDTSSSFCPSINRTLVLLLALCAGLQILLLLRTERARQPCSRIVADLPVKKPAPRVEAPPPSLLPPVAKAPPPRHSPKSARLPPEASYRAVSPNHNETAEHTPWSKHHRGWQSANWAVAGQEEKRGAGLLFFAYGGKQLHHFLDEAILGASSFRERNPRILIALVSNTERMLNRSVFNFQIKPRPDLLFAGSTTNGDWGDNLPRQWLTRLYYLAHSPFMITWALDSNVYACTYGAAQLLLDDAIMRDMWGFDIATANQREGPMYPHNFNLLYKWSPRTSALMRDWLMLQMRRGLATDDQKTLQFAEIRAVAAGGLSVGQVASPYAAALYNALTIKAKSGVVTFRISRVLRGPAHILHTKNPSDCAVYNEFENEERQLLQISHKATGAGKSNVSKRSIFSLGECEISLAGGGVAAGLVSFESNVTRRLCKFRDIGPRMTVALHEELTIAARLRNASVSTFTWLDKRLRADEGFDSYNSSLNPRRRLAVRNVQQYPAWPPVFKPPLEAINVSRHFGHVDIDD